MGVEGIVGVDSCRRIVIKQECYDSLRLCGTNACIFSGLLPNTPRLSLIACDGLYKMRCYSVDAHYRIRRETNVVNAYCFIWRTCSSQAPREIIGGARYFLHEARLSPPLPCAAIQACPMFQLYHCRSCAYTAQSSQSHDLYRMIYCPQSRQISPTEVRSQGSLASWRHGLQGSAMSSGSIACLNIIINTCIGNVSESSSERSLPRTSRVMPASTMQFVF